MHCLGLMWRIRPRHLKNMIDLENFLLRYLQAFISLPAALLVLILVAYDVISLYTRQKKQSRGGVYWLFTKSLVFFDRLVETDLTLVKESDIEWRCLWYRVHITRVKAENFPQGRNVTGNQAAWRQINNTIYAGDMKNPILELNHSLWMIAKCCLIRLQETPLFLHEDYPQPRCVLHAFLLHCTPLLLKIDKNSKAFLCQRLESLLMLLGVAQVHSSGHYSVRRLLRQNTLSQNFSYATSRPSWRFSFWTFVRTKYCQQLALTIFPSLAVHLAMHPSFSLELLSDNYVVASYIKEGETLLEATRQFVRDLFDILDLWDAPKKALFILNTFDAAIMASLPQRSGEIPTLCDEDNAYHRKSIISNNLDFIETQQLLASAYLCLGAHEKGLQRIKIVCELLDASLSQELQEISYSLRSLALVAWARNNVGKNDAREESHDSQKPDTVRLIGEQLFSLHLELKMSPTEGKLLEAAAPLSLALSEWQRQFAEYSEPPCWTKCRNEVMSLIHVSRIGLNAFDSLSKHFFADSVIKHKRSDFARIHSTLSDTFL
jgi:hypothetical protein